MAKTLEDIRVAWDAGEYYYHPSDLPKKIREGYVFDEDKSVRENREMVEAHNLEVDRKKKEASNINAERQKRFTDDVVEYLMDSYNFSRKQAARVESYVYAEKHSYMGDYFGALDEVADLVSDVVNMK